MSILHKSLQLLTPSEKKRGIMVLLMVTCMAGLEVAGVASIIPILSVLGNPDIVQTNATLSMLFELLGFKSIKNFLVFLGIGSFALVITSAGFRIFAHYVMNRYIEMRRHSLSERLLETYLRQPYAFFLDRNSADLAKSILSEVDQLMGNVFKPGIMAVAYSVMCAGIIAFLLFIDPWVALWVAVIISGLYAIIFYGVQKILLRIGRERADANYKRFTIASEVLSGIKDIKLLGSEWVYLSRFRPASIRFSRNVANSQTLSQTPKFLIEGVAIGGILGLTVLLMLTRENLGEILPLLGVYAFAGYKLLPAGQHVYQGLAQLRFGAAAVDDIHADLLHRFTLAELPKQAPQAMLPKQEVYLEKVSFTYPKAQSPALQRINIRLPMGSCVGLVGGTGAGKTTLVDIILGLLPPSEGKLLVDGTPITKDNLRSWQQALGYVAQDIFISDATVAENIALGVPPEYIDSKAVQDCARMAQVHDFITEHLPRGYDTEVGEGGIRLSGGQRQRIGIARALYQNPAMLIFDEATSALDHLTEQAVMKSIYNLAQAKSIVLIAHRLSTVKGCDCIYVLEEGQVVGSGTYEELALYNSQFQELTQGIGD